MIFPWLFQDNFLSFSWYHPNTQNSKSGKWKIIHILLVYWHLICKKICKIDVTWLVSMSIVFRLFVTPSLETKEFIVPLELGLGQVGGGIHISDLTVFSLFFQQVWKKDFNEAHCCFIMECNTSNMFSTLHVWFNSTFTHIWHINKFVTHCTQRLSVIRLKWLQPVLVLLICVPRRDVSTNSFALTYFLSFENSQKHTKQKRNRWSSKLLMFVSYPGRFKLDIE